MPIPNTLCQQCNSSGLSIMPVRYTVVPSAVKPGLPTWAGGDRVSSVALDSEFQYALRTLREGYVYVFYDKNRRGSKQWECYAVGEDGSLRLQQSPQAAQPQGTPTLQCSRTGHSNTLVHYFVIEQPQKCGTAWIAFTHQKWSDDTLKAYSDSSSLRNKRMQTINPSALAGGAKHSHGAIASAKVLEDVIEYAPGFDPAILPFGGSVPTLSKEDGSLADASRLNRVSTRYPWHLRKGQAAATSASMHERGRQGNGKQNSPHVLALWDAIGIAHEINGYRSDAAGWIKKYSDEREFELDAIANYDGLQVAMTTHAGQQQQQMQDAQLSNAANWYDPQNMALRRSNAATLSEPQRSRQLQSCDILDNWASNQVPDLGYQARLTRANMLDEPQRSAEIARLKSDVAEFLKRRANNYKTNIHRAAAGAWPSYEKRIAESAKTFRDNRERFDDRLAAIIDQRTPTLIRWLESKLFIDTLNNYHGQSIDDGLLFDEAVSEAMFGLGSCKAGASKISQWVAECKATVEDNLLWRVMALNQDEARQEFDQILAEAKSHKEKQTLSSTLTWVGYSTKSVKAVADTYKKAQGVFDSNTSASTGGAKAFGAALQPARTFGADKAVITFGDKVFKHFRIDKLGDYASEKIIQHVFSVRAFVHPADSENLVAKQAVGANLGREQTLRRMSATAGFMKMKGPEVKLKQVEDMREAWAKFKADDKGGEGARSVKGARLAVVVMLIEGVNFAKLMAECQRKGDNKSYFSLLASGMSITSALFDIAAVPAKVLSGSGAGLGAESITYQTLKGWGGVLSGGATVIGAWFDFADAKKSRAEGYGLVYRLYLAKGAAGTLSAALTLATTYSYAAGVVARLTGRAIAVQTGESVAVAVGERAAAIIGLRIIGMTLGGWVTVGIFGIQVIIWIVTPNALEKWIDQSAFGKLRDMGGRKNSREQDEKLKEALVEMGVSQ